MKNYWDSELTGKIEYGMLESIIARYFQVHQGINIKYLDLNPLKDSIEEKEPTFVVETEFGKTHYTISIADLQEIVKEYLALKNYELKEMNFTDKGAHIIFKRMSNEREESTYNSQKNMIKIQNRNRIKAIVVKTSILLGVLSIYFGTNDKFSNKGIVSAATTICVVGLLYEVSQCLKQLKQSLEKEIDNDYLMHQEVDETEEIKDTENMKLERNFDFKRR